MYSVTDYIKECDICHKEDGILYVTSYEKILCEDCIRKYDPPRMTLVTYDLSQTIFNLEVGEYEKIKNVYTFEQCGWFVRSRQISVYQLVPRAIMTVW